MKKMKSFLTMFMVAALIVSCIPAAAFAAETDVVYEKESNNLRSQATKLKPGQKGIGAINEGEYRYIDTDYYKCTVPSNGYVTVSLGAAPGAEESKLGGWTSWTAYVYFDDVFGEFGYITDVTTGTETIKFPAAAGETVYVKVVPTSNGTAFIPYDVEYQITVNCVANKNWEVEFNDSRSTATALKNNVKMYGNLEGSYDWDYWKYTVKEDSKINFTFRKDSMDIEDVEDGWYVQVMSSDNPEPLYSVNVKGNTFKSPNFGFKKGTTVYIRVTTNTRNATPTGIDYRITLNAAKNTKWENEGNNTSKAAKTLTGNTKYFGNLSYDYDEDYFKIKGAKKGKMNIYFGKNNADDEMDYGWTVIVKVDGNTVEYFNNVTNLYKGDRRIGYVNVKKGQIVTVTVQRAWSTSYPEGITYALKCKNV